MKPTDQLTQFCAAIAAQVPAVREQYRTLETATDLMRKHGAQSVEEAIHQEARVRVLRERRS